jgi:GntR family transcriptional regulator
MTVSEIRRPGSLTDQVVAELLTAVQTGEYQPGQQLPPVDRLAANMRVGRSTMREALRLLQARGLVQIIHGRGTFVARPTVTRATGVLGFSEMSRERGQTAHSRILYRKRLKADKETAQKLQIPLKTEVNVLKRLRLIDELPIGIETSISVYARFPDLLELDWAPDASLYALLQARYGVIPTTASQRVSARLMDKEKSHLLGVEPPIPALLVETVAYDQYGVPFECGHSWYAGDRYDYYVDLKRE